MKITITPSLRPVSRAASDAMAKAKVCTPEMVELAKVESKKLKEDDDFKAKHRKGVVVAHIIDIQAEGGKPRCAVKMHNAAVTFASEMDLSGLNKPMAVAATQQATQIRKLIEAEIAANSEVPHIEYFNKVKEGNKASKGAKVLASREIESISLTPTAAAVG